MDLWHSIRQKWEQEGLPAPPGVIVEALSAFERGYSVALPHAMRGYFEATNGNGGMDRDFYTFWPLEEMKPVREELVDPIHTDRFDYPDCYLFADYLLWCWAYAIHLTGDAETNGPIYLVGGETPVVVAATFLEFMQKYAADPDSLMTGISRKKNNLPQRIFDAFGVDQLSLEFDGLNSVEEEDR